MNKSLELLDDIESFLIPEHLVLFRLARRIARINKKETLEGLREALYFEGMMLAPTREDIDTELKNDIQTFLINLTPGDAPSAEDIVRRASSMGKTTFALGSLTDVVQRYSQAKTKYDAIRNGFDIMLIATKGQQPSPMWKIYLKKHRSET